jgi:hypothetical protein
MVKAGGVGDDDSYDSADKQDETTDGTTSREQLEGIPGVFSGGVESSCFHEFFFI